MMTTLPGSSRPRDLSIVDMTNLLRRLDYAQALHEYAQALQFPANDEASRRNVMVRALKYLRTVTDATCAGIFENVDDEELGFCSRIVAETCTEGVELILNTGATSLLPWADSPLQHQEALSAGRPVGGPTGLFFSDTPRLRKALLDRGVLSLQFFPIHIEEKWWGHIGFKDHKQAREWSKEEVLLLRTAAEILSGALARWRVEENLREARDRAAVQHERERLAQEFHDAVTQSLYSLMLFARAGSDALTAGEPTKAIKAMLSVEEMAGRALVEMRLLLFELLPATEGALGLPDAIEERFRRVERRLGIHATCETPAGLRIAPQIEHVLYRIALEALNNSLKHASAQEVRVSIRKEDDVLELSIRDNGVGFEVNGTREGMGLRSMAQRAHEIGATIRISSAPDAGTLVTLRVEKTVADAREPGA